MEKLPPYEQQQQSADSKRELSIDSSSQAVPPRLRKLHDPDVTFQEYQHYAKLTREEEELRPEPVIGKNFLAYLIPNLQKVETGPVEVSATVDTNMSSVEARKQITDEEWLNASRALKTASAGACFYLITTDILGPFGLPYAFATTGWGFVSACPSLIF